MLLNIGKKNVEGSNPDQGFIFERYFHCLTMEIILCVIK